MTYGVNERFLTWQGEGAWSGQCAYFIRLHGCDQRCPWCDSAGTWHPEFIPKSIERFDAAGLADAVPIDKPFGFTVLTGGEPAMYDLEPVIDAIREKSNRPVHLETAGHRPIRGNPNWITLSPKPFAALPLRENVQRASEFKLIIEHQDDIERALESIEDRRNGAPIYLHPEWSQRDNQAVQQTITGWIKKHGSPFRAGYQLHKLYRADFDDPNARRTWIPLGGDESRGY